MKDKRIIVLQPYCTCVLEIICRERLENLPGALTTTYFNMATLAGKGSRGLICPSQMARMQESCWDRHIIPNLDVIKAFDKMSPKMIFPLLRNSAPLGLLTAIEHLYYERVMTFKNLQQKLESPDRTLLMQGGALGPTMYKCLKLGVLLVRQGKGMDNIRTGSDTLETGK